MVNKLTIGQLQCVGGEVDADSISLVSLAISRQQERYIVASHVLLDGIYPPWDLKD